MESNAGTKILSFLISYSEKSMLSTQILEYKRGFEPDFQFRMLRLCLSRWLPAKILLPPLLLSSQVTSQKSLGENLHKTFMKKISLSVLVVQHQLPNKWKRSKICYKLIRNRRNEPPQQISKPVRKESSKRSRRSVGLLGALQRRQLRPHPLEGNLLSPTPSPHATTLLKNGTSVSDNFLLSNKTGEKKMILNKHAARQRRWFIKKNRKTWK